MRNRMMLPACALVLAGCRASFGTAGMVGEHAITQYGGDTRGVGTAARQEFYAGAHTSTLIPAAATNVWTMEVIPGERFACPLCREGMDRRFRVESGLTRPVAPPPAPWGARE